MSKVNNTGKSPMKQSVKPYQAFFKKRLQTESFLDSHMGSTYGSNLTSKIVSSLKNATLQGSRLRQRQMEARQRLKTQQKDGEESRGELRSKIEQKMRISQTNLNKINEDRKKALSSRSHFEKSQRDKIKQQNKREMEKSLMQLHENQEKSEKFFRESQYKKKAEYERQQRIPSVRNYNDNEESRYQQSPQRTRYESYNNKVNASLWDSRSKSSMQKNKQMITQMSKSSLEKSEKSRAKVLVVSDKEIHQKQEKKKALEKKKQCRYLSEYISKMEEIANVRKKGVKAPKEPTATFPKVISNERSNNFSRKRASFANNNTEYARSTSKKASFSELYMEKLHRKRQMMEEEHLALLAEGDHILERQREQTKILKQNRIIRDSINQYKRWSSILANQNH